MSFRQENEFYEGTKGEHLVRLWGSEENFRSIQTEEEYGIAPSKSSLFGQGRQLRRLSLIIISRIFVSFD